MAFLGRLFQPPKASHFLFGPRGTGKSTFLRQAFPDALWVDLLTPEVAQRYAARPGRLRALLDGERDADVVVIDEVQKVPALLDVVHQTIDRLLYRGDERLEIHGVRCEPCEAYLAGITPGRPLG